MLVIKVELWSAVNGQKSEIARMVIANDGKSEKPTRGNYECATYRGRSKDAFDKAMLENLPPQRSGRVDNFPRISTHVWFLVARALRSMKYY